MVLGIAAAALAGCGGDESEEPSEESITIDSVRQSLEDAGYRVSESNDQPIRFFSYLGEFEPQSTLEVRDPELESIPQVYEFADEAEAASVVDRFAYDGTEAAQLGPVMISSGTAADQETVVEAAGGESPSPEPTDIEEIRTGLEDAGFELTEDLPEGAAEVGVEAAFEVKGDELTGNTGVFGFSSEEEMLSAAGKLADRDFYPALLGPNLVFSEKSENVATVVEALTE